MLGTTLLQLIEKDSDDNYKDPTFLNFLNKKITKIGHIPIQISNKVRVLNLSHNCLKSTEGIQQFKLLQSLDLSNNKISSGSCILGLTKLVYMKRLLLKGNPFLQNPLNEEILTFVSSFDNDLQILNNLYANDQRQSLIHQYKMIKSQNTISAGLRIKRSSSQQYLQNLPKNIQMSKMIQKSKVSMLLSNMQEFIEEQQESQQVSSQSINGDALMRQSIDFLNLDASQMEKPIEKLTPIKKSPKFGSFYVENKTFNDVSSHQTKLNEESTTFKGGVTLTNKSKCLEMQSPFESHFETMNFTDDKITEEKSFRSQSLSRNFKKSPEKDFKYQVDNMKIKMQIDNAALNYPSIIQKEDQDSYQIEFDFMSPQKLSDSKRKGSLQTSPCYQLKELTASYVKIQQDQITLNKNGQDQKKQSLSQKEQTNFYKVHSQSLQKYSLPKKTNSYLNQPKPKSLYKKFDKENIFQQKQERKEQPLIMSRKGSLHQSTRYLVPQTNTSTALDIINKLLFNKSQTESFSFSNSLSEMIENGQKFERFYYTSLTRLKPVFNLLYSPFSSLKTEEKDMLLQELFKNHKQIFILFIREFHARQKLQDEIQVKSTKIYSLQEEIQQTRESFTKKLRQTSERANEFSEKIDFLESNLQKLSKQNFNLNKEAYKFEQILNSRQKIINDVQLQYEKANKALARKQLVIKKFTNQDQKEQQIQIRHQTHIKRQFLGLIAKKASKIYRLHQFQMRRKQRQAKNQQASNNQVKRLIFQALRTNTNRQTSVKKFIKLRDEKNMSSWFNEWKKAIHLSKKSSKVQQALFTSHKIEFIQLLRNFNLKRQRTKKIQNFIEIRLKKKSFYEGFKKNHQASKAKYIESLLRAQLLHSSSLMRSHFTKLRLSKNISDEARKQNELKIMSVIEKSEFSLFVRIIRFQKKQQQFKIQSLREKIIKTIESKLLFKFLKAQTIQKSKSIKNMKLSTSFRLERIFKAFKLVSQKNLKKFEKFKPLVRKLAHEERLKKLIIDFKQNGLSQKLSSKSKTQFLTSFGNFHQVKLNYSNKQIQLTSFLNFRRAFKAKTNFIYRLRHFNVLKKMKNKQQNLSEHFHMQKDKYKQSHELNMFTVDHLKSEIDTYLNEIQFYKLQVQKLSQRQLFILEQKQNCLIEIQCRDQENLELKTILIQNQKKLEELEKKYEKSLDMYANAIQEVGHQSTRIEQTKTAFLYETVAGSRSPATFRREANEVTFSSQKR